MAMAGATRADPTRPSRRDRQHDVHHLLLAMLAVDRRVRWVLDELGVDQTWLSSAVERAFPLRRGHLLLRIERRLARNRDIVQRYLLPTSG